MTPEMISIEELKTILFKEIPEEEAHKIVAKAAISAAGGGRYVSAISDLQDTNHTQDCILRLICSRLNVNHLNDPEKNCFFDLTEVTRTPNALIAKILKLSTDTISRHSAPLVEKGYLRRQLVSSRKGYHKEYEYSVTEKLLWKLVNTRSVNEAKYWFKKTGKAMPSIKNTAFSVDNIANTKCSVKPVCEAKKQEIDTVSSTQQSADTKCSVRNLRPIYPADCGQHTQQIADDIPSRLRLSFPYSPSSSLSFPFLLSADADVNEKEDIKEIKTINETQNVEREKTPTQEQIKLDMSVEEQTDLNSAAIPKSPSKITYNAVTDSVQVLKESIATAQTADTVPLESEMFETDLKVAPKSRKRRPGKKAQPKTPKPSTVLWKEFKACFIDKTGSEPPEIETVSLWCRINKGLIEKYNFNALMKSIEMYFDDPVYGNYGYSFSNYMRVVGDLVTSAAAGDVRTRVERQQAAKSHQNYRTVMGASKEVKRLGGSAVPKPDKDPLLM